MGGEFVEYIQVVPERLYLCRDAFGCGWGEVYDADEEEPARCGRCGGPVLPCKVRGGRQGEYRAASGARAAAGEGRA